LGPNNATPIDKSSANSGSLSSVNTKPFLRRHPPFERVDRLLQPIAKRWLGGARKIRPQNLQQPFCVLPWIRGARTPLYRLFTHAFFQNKTIAAKVVGPFGQTPCSIVLSLLGARFAREFDVLFGRTRVKSLKAKNVTFLNGFSKHKSAPSSGNTES
jgi:hypothetical protein